MSSIGLKGAAAPPNDGLVAVRPVEVEAELVNRLRAQGFATEVRRFRERSAIVLASRGDCRLAARDARGGTMFMTIFASDTASIGSIRYLYRGSSYDLLPAVAMRIGRFETETQTRFGMPASAHIAIALSTSPGCGGNAFGLEDVTAPV